MNKSKFLPIIGVIILIVILIKVDLNKTVFYLRNIIWYYFLSGILLSVPLVLLKSFKWQRLLKVYNIKYSFLKTTVTWLSGFFVGGITPGKVGEIAKAFYLKKDSNISFGRALTSVIIDRIFDIWVLILFGIFGGAYIAHLFLQRNIIPSLLVLVTLSIFGIYIITKKSPIKKLIKPIFRVFIPKKHKEKIRSMFHDFYIGVITIKANKKALFILFSLTTSIWLITFFQFFLLSKSLTLNISYILIVCVMAVELLSEILPISFSGIGTREAVMIYFFGKLGTDPSAIIGFSLLILLTDYIVSLFGGATFIKRSLRTKRN